MARSCPRAREIVVVARLFTAIEKPTIGLTKCYLFVSTEVVAAEGFVAALRLCLVPTSLDI